jgi:hypothetical protein
MGSEKVLYWIAVGVLAIFVTNSFAARHEDGVRCLARRALAAVEQVSAHATDFMAQSELVLGRGEFRCVRTQTALAGAQAGLASLQGMLASHEAVLARVETEHAEMVAMQRLNGRTICPRQNSRIVIPQPLRNGTI